LSKTHAKVTKIAKVLKQKPVPPKQEPATRRLPIEVAISESKFSALPKAGPEKRVYAVPTDLPSGYAQDRIILQVRDPWWIHAYWEVTQSTWARLKREFPIEATGGFKKILRVYDVSQIIFTGDNAHRFFDIEITEQANNWYIDTQGPGRSWCVDFGIRLSNGQFITVVRSNTVSTPIAGPSWITDEEWMIPEDMFARLYGMGVGIGSSPRRLKRLWEERLKGEIGSGGLSSLASPVKKQKLKVFWLTVNTELIVYGQTQANAKVTIAGQPVSLRPDGSFSLRLFLPDGKQVIPVVATSSDGEQVKNITPIVTKETS
jgi:hypothetical protein